MEYCPHCMARNVSGQTCPVCGGDLNWTGQKGLDLPVGITLTGGNGLRTYWIGAARGKGGFGITYGAMETTSHRRVAIKEYFPVRCAFRAGNGVDVQTLTGQETFFQGGMKSFLDEARMLLAQEDLPSVVHVIDFFEANGTAYLVMEYLDGLPLHAYMNKLGGTIPAQDLLEKLDPVIRDLGVLHERGILHRDISPDNLMWMPNGTIKLLDFGSARNMENGKSMTLLMKEGFSPVEQYRSRGQGSYTDVYSMAATIYYCTTGMLPPGAIERLENDFIRSPIELGAALTVEQESAILWGLSVQPSARPQTMEEFHEALYAKSATPPSPPPPPVPPQPFEITDTNEIHTTNTTGTDTSTSTATKLDPIHVTTTITDSTDGSTGGKTGKEKNIVTIAIAVIIAIVVIAIVAIFFNSGGSHRRNASNPDDLPAITPSITRQPDTEREPPISTPLPTPKPTPESTPEPTPEPTPSVVEGTADGYTYEIHGDYAVLTGYTGQSLISRMPSDIDDVPITEIEDKAFAGADLDSTVYLPKSLEQIGSNVFQGSKGLSFLVASSNFSMEDNSFSGCSLQDVILFDEAADIQWTAEGDYRILSKASKTKYGRIERFITNGDLALYAVTDEDVGVLLDIVDTGEDYTLLDGLDDDTYTVVWIDEAALDHLTDTITLPETCLFDFSLYNEAEWAADTDTLADMWLLSCELATRINTERSGDGPEMVPDATLLKAAQVRAEEQTQLYGEDRPDGSEDIDLLNELDIPCDFYLRGWSRKDPWTDAFLDDFAGKIAPPSTVNDKDGILYEKIGVAYYTDTDEDGDTLWYDYLFTTTP